MNKEPSQIFHIKGVDFSGQMLICQNNSFNIKLIPAPGKHPILSRIRIHKELRRICVVQDPV